MKAEGIIFLFLTGIGMLFCGCGGDKRPEGMPELKPVTLTITQDGAPLTNASVTLIAQDSANAIWPAGGTTNSSGVLKVKTMSKFDGAPIGKYKIVVEKTETTGADTAVESSDEAGATAAKSDVKSYNLVESQFRSAASTPLELEVTASGGNSQKFDVGKAVREPIQVHND